MSKVPPSETQGTVISKDGTTIGYRRLGHGPGLILVHGGMRSSQDFMKLAEQLQDSFTVYVPDRRGRGMSGPHGDNYAVMREVEDMLALIAKTGARYMYGLSSGALVTLKTALGTQNIHKAAVYEPALSINGSVPTDWVPRYASEVANGRLVSAVVTALKGLGIDPMFKKLPRWVLTPVGTVVFKLQGASRNNHVALRSLVPTLGFDMQIVKEMSDTQQSFSALQIPVLLMGGTNSPPYLSASLDSLFSILPYAQRKSFAGLGHEGGEDAGRPKLIAGELRGFFQV